MTQKLLRSLVALVFLAGFTPAKALKIPVVSALDNVTGSLRLAVSAASSGDTISFDLALDGVPVVLAGSEVIIDKSLTIVGNGSVNTMISANNLSRIFNVSSGASVVIQDLMLMNGSSSGLGGAILCNSAELVLSNTVITNSTASGAAATEGGGGIANVGGNITIIDSEISNNTASGMSGSGGGILNLSDGTLTVTNSTITGNTAMRAGGGIEDNSGESTVVTLVDVTLSDNTTGSAPGNGGGVHITGPGDMDITGGMVTGNTAAAEGGGLWNGAGLMTVTNVMIDGNTASGNDADQGGGGIYNLSGTLMVTGGVISNNTADGMSGSGGGILNDAGATLMVDGTEITANTAMRAGGGIEDNSGESTVVTLVDVTLSDNTTGSAPGNGGGVHITGPGDMDITGGMVTGNTAAAEGGGLWNGAGLMTVTNVMIDGNTASGNDADQGGGGIYNLSGTLMVTGGVISNNTADGMSGSGGGILNDAGATLMVDGTEITANTAMRAGGGIEDNSGEGTVVTLVDVTLSDNTTGSAPGNGGGVHITGPGDMDITGGMVTGNTAAAEGGGLWNGAGLMTVTNVMIDGNTAMGNSGDQGGGGVFNAGGTIEVMTSTISNNMSTNMSNGGGLHNDGSGMVTLTLSTISGNSTSSNGGGIANNGTLIIEASTIANNAAMMMGGGCVQLEAGNSADFSSSIVAANSADGTGQDVAGMGMMTSSGYNLIGEDDTDVFTGLMTDIVGGAGMPFRANLAPLADNGGMTPTHALICPSPAIDAGAPDNNMPDQTGAMVFGMQRDIGAFEFQEECEITSTNSADGNLSGSSITPNPSKIGHVQLNIPTHFGDEVSVSIRSLATGQLLNTQQVSTGQTTLNYTQLSAGSYLIQVQAKGGLESHRLILVD